MILLPQVPTRDVPLQNSGIHQVMETISESETCRVTGCFRYDAIYDSELQPVHFPLEDCVRSEFDLLLHAVQCSISLHVTATHHKGVPS